MTMHLIQKPNIKDIKTNKYIGGKYIIVTDEYLEQNKVRIKQFNIIPLSERDLEKLSSEGYYKELNDAVVYYDSVDSGRYYSIEEGLPQEAEPVQSEMKLK